MSMSRWVNLSWSSALLRSWAIALHSSIGVMEASLSLLSAWACLSSSLCLSENTRPSWAALMRSTVSGGFLRPRRAREIFQRVTREGERLLRRTRLLDGPAEQSHHVFMGSFRFVVVAEVRKSLIFCR